MENSTQATKRDHWSRGHLHQEREIPAELEKGDTWIFFPALEKIEGFEGAVFPFTLPDNDPSSMAVTDCILFGCLGNPEPEDVKKLVSSTIITLTSFEGVERQKVKLQHTGPTVTFAWGFASRTKPLFLPPYRQVLAPDYTIFHIYLHLAVDVALSAPVTVCIVMDAYMPK